MHTRIQLGLMMICLLLALLVVSCSSTSPENSTTEVSTDDTATNILPEEDNTPTEIKVGDKSVLMQNMEIVVMNPERIGDKYYGTFGSVYTGNWVQVVARGDEKEGLLVRYGTRIMFLTDECPPGTLFFMNEESFRAGRKSYEIETEEKRMTEKEHVIGKKRIKELLKQEEIDSKK